MTACQYRPQHGNGLRLVVFNTDQHLARLQDVGKDPDPLDNLRGAVLHQPVISGDVRLAFGGVDD